MVTKTGDNLIITINCEYLPHNNWMTFASWYSITKNLPDAKCIILCKRGLSRINLYEWTHKCKIPIYYSNYDVSKAYCDFYHINIDCDVMAIDVWNYDCVGPYDVKSDLNCTFVNYFNECGNFKGSEWTNTINVPFNHIDSFYSDDLNLNENKVFRIWNKCKNIFNYLK